MRFLEKHRFTARKEERPQTAADFGGMEVVLCCWQRLWLHCLYWTLFPSHPPNFPCLSILPPCQINSTVGEVETLPQEAGLLLTGRDAKSQKSPVLSMSIQRSLVHALKSKQRDPKVRLPPIITCLGGHGFSSWGFTDPRIIVSLPEPESRSSVQVNCSTQN